MRIYAPALLKSTFLLPRCLYLSESTCCTSSTIFGCVTCSPFGTAVTTGAADNSELPVATAASMLESCAGSASMPLLVILRAPTNAPDMLISCPSAVSVTESGTEYRVYVCATIKCHAISVFFITFLKNKIKPKLLTMTIIHYVLLSSIKIYLC